MCETRSRSPVGRRLICLQNTTSRPLPCEWLVSDFGAIHGRWQLGIHAGRDRIGTGKSLASYRGCLGCKDAGTVICWARGSFDRGDLKEADGAAVRAMEPQA